MKQILLASTAVRFVAAFNSETVETVTINTGAGPTRINKSDYDPKKHGKLAGAAADGGQSADQPQASGVPTPPEGAIIPPAPSAPNFGGPGPEAGGPTQPVKDAVKQAVTPSVPSHDTIYIMPEGSGAKQRFYLVDATGKRVEHADVDEKGYKTQEDAQTALDTYKRNIPH